MHENKVSELGEIQRVDSETASRIIRTREPLGRFYHRDTSGKRVVYVAIDNRTKNAWTEEFDDFLTCWRFLRGCRVRDLHGDWVG